MTNLLEQDSDCSMDKFGRFPSHYAAERGNADCLDILASYDEVDFIFQQMLNNKSKGKG